MGSWMAAWERDTRTVLCKTLVQLFRGEPQFQEGLLIGTPLMWLPCPVFVFLFY